MCARKLLTTNITSPRINMCAYYHYVVTVQHNTTSNRQYCRVNVSSESVLHMASWVWKDDRW